MIKTYWGLMKPGIIYGNLLTAVGAFLFASSLLGPGSGFNFGLFLATSFGLSAVVASACIFNNYLDRDIDARMARTKNRALVSGEVDPGIALGLAVFLGLFGSLILGLWANTVAQAAALSGLFFYVVVYGLAKRRSHFGTLVGSISGAIPPVVGYSAVMGRLDKAAGVLFLSMVFWQMPHFYAIAIYRLREYKSAEIPVLPAVKKLKTVKLRMLGYIVAFAVAAAWLSFWGYTGYVYLAIMTIVSLLWFRFSLEGLKTSDSTAWARQMFKFSLIVVLVYSLMLAVGVRLP